MSGLGEIAADQLSLPHDQIGYARLDLLPDLGAFEDRHHDRGMHVEGERRRGTALRQRLERDRVPEQPDPGAAPFLRDIQRKQPLLAQPMR